MPFVDYQPRGAARELFRCRQSEVILDGPAGTGKSRAVLEKLHACAEKYAGCRLLIVRKTRTSLTNTGLITYEKLVLPPGAARLNYQEATYPNGSVIVFGGLDKSTKIMSSEYDVAYVQEATELTEAEWEDITTRLRWGTLPYQQILADCNPSYPTHWLKRRSDDKRALMMPTVHEDNPTLWAKYNPKIKDHGGEPWEGMGWTPKGRAYIAKLDALSGVRKQRLRHGIWAAAEGMVYENYNEQLHLIARFPIPKEWIRIWVVDFGFTNPFVWQCWAMDPDGRVYRIFEIYHTQRTVDQHCEQIIKVCREKGEPVPVAIICDHDAESRARFEHCIGAITGLAYKAVAPGVQAVLKRLSVAADGKPRLFLLRDSLVERDEDLNDRKKPVCTEDEILAYVWPKNKEGKEIKENPVKIDDHGCDALRYLVAFVDDLGIDPSGKQQHVVTYNDYSSMISIV